MADRSDGAIVLDLAWRQIDKKDDGYIYGRDFIYLFDAIDSLLNARVLNSTGRVIVKDFCKTEPHHKIKKQDFKTLFNTLLGTSFNNALESISYDKTLLELEKGDDSILPDVPVLTSTPNKNDESGLEDRFKPNFKTEYSKIKKLQDNSEDEIRYRDQLIEQFEQKETLSRDKDLQLKTYLRKISNLEDEITYRDKIIKENQEELLDKNLKLKKLQDRIKLMEQEIQDFRNSSNSNFKSTTLNTTRHSDFFNNALQQRVKEQQRAINTLKETLASKSDIITNSSIIIPPVNQSSTQSIWKHDELSSTWSYTLYSLIILILLYTIFAKLSSITGLEESWFVNTFLEPLIYKFGQEEIDYDYYNLGDVTFDYLQKEI